MSQPEIHGKSADMLKFWIGTAVAAGLAAIAYIAYLTPRSYEECIDLANSNNGIVTFDKERECRAKFPDVGPGQRVIDAEVRKAKLQMEQMENVSKESEARFNTAAETIVRQHMEDEQAEKIANKVADRLLLQQGAAGPKTCYSSGRDSVTCN